MPFAVLQIAVEGRTSRSIDGSNSSDSVNGIQLRSRISAGSSASRAPASRSTGTIRLLQLARVLDLVLAVRRGRPTAGVITNRNASDCSIARESPAGRPRRLRSPRCRARPPCRARSIELREPAHELRSPAANRTRRRQTSLTGSESADTRPRSLKSPAASCAQDARRRCFLPCGMRLEPGSAGRPARRGPQLQSAGMPPPAEQPPIGAPPEQTVRLVARRGAPRGAARRAADGV